MGVCRLDPRALASVRWPLLQHTHTHTLTSMHACTAERCHNIGGRQWGEQPGHDAAHAGGAGD